MVDKPYLTPILEFCPRSGHSAGTQPSYPALVFSRIYRKSDFAGGWNDEAKLSMT
jgi:hypothetical protein